MTHQAQPWRRPLLLILVLAAAVAAAPLPVLGAEPGSPPPGQPPPGLRILAQQAVAAMPPAALRASAAPVQAPAGAGKEELTKWSFFKSPVGIAVMATFAVGVGYFLYSTQNDRITSPAKQ